MKHIIFIHLEPLSINKVHCRDTRYLTAYYEQYKSDILHLISESRIQTKLKELREYFNPEIHVYKLDLTFYYPREVFYTLDNKISSKMHDISNIEKPLIDLLFLPKFFGDNPPYKALNLNADDKYLVEMASRKLPSEKGEHLMAVQIEIVHLQALEPNLE